MKLKKTTARQPSKRLRGPVVKSTNAVSGKRLLSRKTLLPKVTVKKAGDEQMISKTKNKTTHSKRTAHDVAHEPSAHAEKKAPQLGHHPRQTTMTEAPAPVVPGDPQNLDTQEAAIVIRAAGEVPRDAEAGVPQKERGSYDGDTAIKLYLREIGQVKLLTPQE